MKIKPDSVGNTEEGISLGKIIIIIINHSVWIFGSRRCSFAVL